MGKLRTIFCGTPDFAVPTLDMLAHHPSIEISKVVSMPDRPAGRGQELKSPEVIEFAKAYKLPYIQTENINKEAEFLAEQENNPADLIIVLAFAQFLGSHILNSPKIGCFNIHTSILPKYRGAAPIQYALLNGDKETGVSIQKMVKLMDAGDLVHSHPVKISDQETGGQLYTRLKFQAALACNDFLINVLNDKITYTPQDESKVSFAPTLKKEDGHLHFEKQTVGDILNRIRALDPWPGTWCMLNNKRLKVLEAIPSNNKLAAGKIESIHGELMVGCLNGTLRLSLIQWEGKKVCSDRELLNGLRAELSLQVAMKESL